MERDPFILTGLMWSWLEQLKEPVISVQQAKDISPYSSDAETFLSTLGKVSELRNSENYVADHVKAHVSSVTLVFLSFQAPRETLTCILDCMARMQMIPEEVENAFLNRTIKAFTWVREEKKKTQCQQHNNFRSLLQHTTTVFAFKQLENNSDEGRVYESMATVLRCVLEDMRCADDEEDKAPMSPLPLA